MDGRQQYTESLNNTNTTKYVHITTYTYQA